MTENELSPLENSGPTRGTTQDPVNPVLPIVATVVWLVVMVAAVFPALFSAMLFDSGGSAPVWMIFAGFWLTIVLCFVSILAGWIVWGTTRRERSRSVRVARGVIYGLPFVPLVMVGIGFLWIETVCSGSLSC